MPNRKFIKTTAFLLAALMLLMSGCAEKNDTDQSKESSDASAEDITTPESTEERVTETNPTEVPEENPTETREESSLESLPPETPEETPLETDSEETPEESSLETQPEETLEETESITEPEDPEITIINLYDRSSAFGGYISADGTKHSYSGHFTSDFIEVTPGEKIYFGPCNPNQSYQLHGYNEDKVAVDKNVQSALVEEDFFPNGHVIYSYTPPKGVKYARFANNSTYNNVYIICREQIDVNSFSAFWGKGNTLDLYEKRNSDGFIEYIKDVFVGKRALFLGDSICAANCESGKDYRGWVGRIISSTGMSCVNRGHSGASLSTARDTNRIINQYNMVKRYQYDYIIMHGGVNDAWESTKVGKMSNSFELSSFDTSTYAGGLEELFYHVTNDHPDSKLGYIFNFATPKFNTGRIADMSEYYAVAKQICEKWNIPYLNMYEDDLLSEELKVNTTACLSDYLHPNTAGYNVLYKYIMYWMETLPVHSEIDDDYELQSYPIKK